MVNTVKSKVGFFAFNKGVSVSEICMECFAPKNLKAQKQKFKYSLFFLRGTNYIQSRF